MPYLNKKKGIKDVIFDVSLNGGGTLGVMMKLLALISKDNSGYVSLYEETTSEVAIYNTHVDINNDKKYDTDDCFIFYISYAFLI